MGDGTEKNPYTREDVLRLIEENGGTAEGLDLSGKTFEKGIDLRDFDLKGIILEGAVFRRVSEEILAKKGVKLEPVESFGLTNIGALLSRAHLEGAKLSNAHLEEASLANAHLEGASLKAAHLEGANLIDAHLEGASLTDGQLESAILAGAYLQEADLTLAHLQEASLFVAHLEGANLAQAHLEGADLLYAHLEGAYLWNIRFSRDTKLHDVEWGNHILGEEKDGNFDKAAEAYRSLKLWYTNAGISDTTAKFYYREKEANRKGLKWCSKSSFRHRLALEASYLVFGHGEDWKRVLYWMAGFILLFALVYFRLGTLTPNTFLNSLYYSAVSFTALGYGSWAPQPSSWVKGLGAFEAFVGVFTMALLLVTFVRKWTR